MCEPDVTLAAPCQVVSIGSNGDASFESDIHKFAPHCKIDTWDGTLVGHRSRLRRALPSYVNFRPRNMDSESWRAYAQHAKAAPVHVNILKVDCEGEWPPPSSRETRAASLCPSPPDS